MSVKVVQDFLDGIFEDAQKLVGISWVGFFFVGNRKKKKMFGFRIRSASRTNFVFQPGSCPIPPPTHKVPAFQKNSTLCGARSAAGSGE
jgi:hypothetical protein